MVMVAVAHVMLNTAVQQPAGKQPSAAREIAHDYEHSCKRTTHAMMLNYAVRKIRSAGTNSKIKTCGEREGIRGEAS